MVKAVAIIAGEGVKGQVVFSQEGDGKFTILNKLFSTTLLSDNCNLFDDVFLNTNYM